MYEPAIIVEECKTNSMAHYTVKPNRDLVEKIQRDGDLYNKAGSSSEERKKEGYRELIREHSFYGFKVKGHFVLCEEYNLRHSRDFFDVAHGKKEANSKLELAAMKHARKLKSEIRKKMHSEPEITRTKAVKHPW